MNDREGNLFRSVTESSWKFYVWVSFLSAVVAWGVFAYTQQLRLGLIVTGMRDQVSWGIYITNFVFFIGISHVGALLSAILRFSEAEWRRPLTRMAEAITTASLFIGGLMPIIDMGRPDRIPNLFLFPRLQSPIVWDIISVGTYFTGSTLFLWVLLVPDIALLRDRFQWRSKVRRAVYRVLSLGYRGTPEQQHVLERAIFAVTLVILPLAISVHTVVSWIFAMTLRPGWDSSIFGPYFVVGALYSGAASVILAMYIFRRVYRLEGYLEPVHFRNLGLLLLALTMLYLYFNINEYFTAGYKFEGSEKALLERLFFGESAFSFWSVQAVGVLIPMLLLMAVLGRKQYQPFIIPGVTLASALVVAGAWVKRYLIIVPTLGTPYLPGQGLPWEWAHYRPTWVEWSITAAGFAGFLLIYTILSKLFPIVSVWETRAERAVEEADWPVPAHTGVWRRAQPLGVLLVAGLLLSAGAVRAQEQGIAKEREDTHLSMEWKRLAPAEPAPVSAHEASRGLPGGARVFLFTERVFSSPKTGSMNREPEKAPTSIMITARLRDGEGQPVAFRAVDFSLKTSFGVLQLGSFPTDQEGKAQLILRDRRLGTYPVEVSFEGDRDYKASQASVNVDFGSRPAPSLPPEGVLISPYPTVGIGLPLLVFYGTIWVVFFYAFGYLVLWRMRRSR